MRLNKANLFSLPVDEKMFVRHTCCPPTTGAIVHVFCFGLRRKSVNICDYLIYFQRENRGLKILDL